MSGGDRVSLATAAKQIGKSGKTLQRWAKRKGTRGSWWWPGKGSGKLVDVAALTRWADGEGLLELPPEGGARSSVDRLTSGPSAASGAPSGGGSLPEKFSADDRDALVRALGIDPAKADEILGLPPKVVRHMAAQAKARKDQADAERRELDNAAKRGELVPIDEVQTFWRGQIEIVHASFRAFPGRIAQRLIGKSYDEISEILEEELDSILRAFAKEVKAA